VIRKSKKYQISETLKLYKESLLLDENGAEKFNVVLTEEAQRNKRSIFNYYNFILQHSLHSYTKDVLNEYFKFSNLMPVQKIDNQKPLFINNLTANVEKIDEDVSFQYKKVSIILTTYNEIELVLVSLKSLLNQTYQNIEIIIVDDASEDDTRSQLEALKKQNSLDITLIFLKQNHGTYIAKNIGLTYAKGDLLTFHDADDWAHPQRIEEHVSEHEKNEKVKFSISKLVRITDKGYFYSRHIYPLDRLSMVSLMIDKSLLKEVGFFRIQRIGSDTEYFERLKKFTKYKFARIDKVLMICAHRDNSLTTSCETGVDGFATTSKRKHHWNQWNQWHKILKKARRKPYVGFDTNKYEHEVL